MDTQTLAWTTVVVATSLGLLGAVVALYRKDNAISIWAMGFGGIALGAILLLLESVLPPGFSLLLGNCLLLSFHFCLLWGLGIFIGADRPWKKQFTFYFAVWVMVMVPAIFVWPSYTIRASAFSLAVVVLSVEFLVRLAGVKKDVYVLVRGLLWFATGGLICFHSFRAIAVLFTSAGNLFTDRQLTTLTLFFTVIFLILWSGALLLLDANRVLAQLKAGTDELERLNRLKDRVLAMTSHDLRGPLGNLRFLWDELAARFRTGSAAEVDPELMRMVDQSLAGTQSLLENLFSFAVFQQTDREKTGSTELVQAVGAVMDQWGGPARTKGVHLGCDFPPAGVEVAGEFVQVTAAIRNLVGNAVKFTPAGGEVRICVFEDPDRGPAVTITDTGVGMDPVLVDRVFQQENRTSRPGTAGERGSGFGLVLVRELVVGWGGSLEVESAPDQGTRVTVWFRVRTKS